jgi:hypothetical protein
VSPEVASPEPLVWRYEVRGLAHADARGVKFAVKCKAKQSVEEVLPLPLPGLDPSVVAAAAAAPAATDGTSQQQHQQQALGPVHFSHELVVPEEHKAALAAALRVEQLDQSPVVGLPGSEAAPVLRLRLHFAPQKAVAAVVQLAVNCSTGARWVYDVNLQVSASLTACRCTAFDFKQQSKQATFLPHDVQCCICQRLVILPKLLLLCALPCAVVERP